MSENKHVEVIIRYGDEDHMKLKSVTPVMPENVPALARALMDNIYMRLDDQVDAKKLRAHRRQLRANRREQAVGQILTTQEKGAGE